MDTHIEVLISSTPLDVRTATQSVTRPECGAIDVFIGTVRNHHEGKAVVGITYDVNQPLAEKIMRDICQEASQRWAGTHYYVAHRVGYVAVGEMSIVIALSSPHRAESFEACRYVIEEIKIKAPIWKKEHYLNGDSGWLPGHSLTKG